MTGRGRTVGAVAAGTVVWATLWVSGSKAAQAALPDLLPAMQRIEHTGILLGYVAYGVLLSIGAGFLTARVAAPGSKSRAVGALAALQLALGVVFETMGWHLTPVWYHLVFLALIVPAILFGGRLGGAGNDRARGTINNSMMLPSGSVSCKTL